MPSSQAALSRQSEVYVNGMAGQKPLIPVGARELEQAARRKMSAEAYAYVAGGAGSESTVRANREAFERRRIVPRMLRDVSERDISVELFGRTLPAPLLTAPIGVLELAHGDADRAVAQAAAAAGVPMIFSSQASVSMEECAREMGGSPRWFQLYWSKNDALVESFVHRAEACGCEAIVVTLDTTLLGWRARDLDLAYLPFLRGKGIAQYVSDPVFLDSLRNPAPRAAGQPKRKVNLHSLGAFAARPSPDACSARSRRATSPPAWAATSSPCSCTTSATPSTSAASPTASSACSSVRSRSPATRSRRTRASGSSRGGRPRSTAPRSCCATPTSPCTRPRTPASSATRSSSRRCTPPCCAAIA
jgi:lactate 2-monooxygenase